MHKLGVSVEFDSAHRLFPYSGKCANIHGHRYRLEVSISGDVSSGGMVIDFGDLRASIKRIVDEKLDHKIILSVADPIKDALTTHRVSVLLLPNSPTAETIVSYIHLLLKKEMVCFFPKLKLDSIRLYETPSCYAEVTDEE
jgi:6-pyruvoyltetrahydropterin/6-carboxytetrahydropterin synthase